MSWEPYYRPNLSSRKGRTSYHRRYPNKTIRYGVEARWDDSDRANPQLIAIRGFTTLRGDRSWTGPSRKTFKDAQNDALNHARNHVEARV
jgi:hypothetical protein